MHFIQIVQFTVDTHRNALNFSNLASIHPAKQMYDIRLKNTGECEKLNPDLLFSQHRKLLIHSEYV